MALATATPDGEPSVRFVLLRGVDERGFVFYTNGRSRKGRDLAGNPRAALVFRWSTVERQVRVTGAVAPVEAAESDAYFPARPRGAQLGAWASGQSEPLDGRAVLESATSRRSPLASRGGTCRVHPGGADSASGRRRSSSGRAAGEPLARPAGLPPRRRSLADPAPEPVRLRAEAR